MEGRKTDTKSHEWTYSAGRVPLKLSSLISGQRFQKPVRRPPHVVGTPRQPRGEELDGFQGLVPAPYEQEDDADLELKPDIMGLAGPGARSQVCCPAGKASRPDTCFMTHRYVKQEIAYLARRIDEVGRYFLALETIIGSGAMGPVLDRALKDLEEHIQHPEKIEEPEVVQGFIDAAVRLGLSPDRYRPLQDRYSWLCHGRYQEELRAQLLEAGVAEDSMELQQLIDDSVRAGITAKELHSARVRLRALNAREFNEGMLSAAVAGDAKAVREKLRTGGDCDAQQQSTEHSLWHIAALQGDQELANLARSYGTRTELVDRSGWTALMQASANHDCELVQALLAARADLAAASERGEVIVECQTQEELDALKLEISNGRIRDFWSDGNHCLDFGDELAAGEELLLPTFQKVGGRTALHAALLRPGMESRRVSVLNELTVDVRAPVNALDDLGNTPLWYAAHSGFLGSAAVLLRAGAVVSLEKCSCIKAAAASFATAKSKMEHGEVWLQLCQLLSRHGATDYVEEMLEAEAAIASSGVTPSFEQIPDLEEAMETAKAAEALESEASEASQALEVRYSCRLLVHRPPSQLASAEDAAAFATSARPEFQDVAFSLAKAFGGYAEVPRKVSALRMTRLARIQRRFAGDFCYTPGAAIDWAAVIGGLEATLIFPSIPDVYKALAELDQRFSCKIRGVWDHLLRRDSARPSWQDARSVRSVDRATSEGLAEAEHTRSGFCDDASVARRVASAGVEAASQKALQGLSDERRPASTVARASVAAAVSKALHSLGEGDRDYSPVIVECGEEGERDYTPPGDDFEEGDRDYTPPGDDLQEDRASAAAVASSSISAAAQKAVATLSAEGSRDVTPLPNTVLRQTSSGEDRASAASVAAASISSAAQKAMGTLAAEGSRELTPLPHAVSRQLQSTEDRASAVAVATASISAAAQKAMDTLAVEGSAEASVDRRSASRILPASEASRNEPEAAEVQVMLECSGAICLLRLTAAGVHQVVQAAVEEGRWVLEELASAMRGVVEGICKPLEAEEEVHEILETANGRLGQQLLTQILAVPLRDSANAWTCTILGLAAHCGLAGVLKLLVDAGAPLSQPRLPPSLSPRGDCSPLSLAVAGHHFQCIALLLASGADPFDDRVDGILLDMLSDDWLEARWFQEKVLRLLEVARSQYQVDSRALAQLGANYDGSAVQVRELRRLLTYGTDPNVKVCPVTCDTTSEAAIPLLSSAAAAGHKELVALLLENGAIVEGHALSLAKGTATEDVLLRRAQARLQRAAAALDLETVAQLVEAGLGSESLLRDRSTLLTYAARLPLEVDPGLALVQVLLGSAASPNTRDVAGRMPLICAAEMGHSELVALLLQHGADVHALSNSGVAAAAVAAKNGSLTVLEVLLDAGARCTDKDPNGDDLSMLALKAGHAECVDAIRLHGHLPHRDQALRELFTAIRRGESGYMTTLLAILVSMYPNLPNAAEDGSVGEAKNVTPTLLIESVRQGSVEMVEALLGAGARLYPQYFPQDVSPDAALEMPRCETAWSLAVNDVPRPEIAALLRQAFPLELLLMARDGTAAEIRNLQQEEASGLIAEEEDFELLDESGNGALDYAISHQNMALETWLCSRGARSPNRQTRRSRQTSHKRPEEE